MLLAFCFNFERRTVSNVCLWDRVKFLLVVILFWVNISKSFAASWLAFHIVAAIDEAIVHHAWNFVVAWQS